MSRKSVNRTFIVKHFSNLALILDKTPEEISIHYTELKNIESLGHKQAENYCNGIIDSDGWEKVTERIKNRLAKILPEKILKNVKLNGDPRGYFLKLDDEFMRQENIELYRDWGGYGIFCPEEI